LPKGSRIHEGNLLEIQTKTVEAEAFRMSRRHCLAAQKLHQKDQMLNI
jgi:hypothetical protein